MSATQRYPGVISDDVEPEVPDDILAGMVGHPVFAKEDAHEKARKTDATDCLDGWAAQAA